MTFSNTNKSSQTSPSGQNGLSHPDTVRAFRTVRQLVIAYLGLSLVTLVVIFAMHNNHSMVNQAVTSRGIGVAFSAALTFFFTNRAAAGSRGAYRRLRFLSPILVVVVAVIVTLPGTYPLWMKIEQVACGLLLLGVAVVTNGRHLRELFAQL
ncbi:hypothetical protein E6W39_09795 [Kitasatospora acidiphila]|uniref:Uncharacterized protein n=1 Tax=Kitasatospora acidiphila TaxID=2567942 RepID=A0A540W0G4_9ACTN|nr:hypothetical protein [Kitasatospora acidiphila]TQF02512.1 hypothetical protein E6W39_09795 [Kitasatospora acidiphila]